MTTAVLSGGQQDAFLLSISQLGEQFADHCMELNRLCIKFYRLVNSQIYRHANEWNEALEVFRESVLSTAEGTRNQKMELYSQIKLILLNPAAVVQHSCVSFGIILESVRTSFLQDTSSQSSQKCDECGNFGGAFATCSGRRCKRVIHIRCVTSELPSKRYRTMFYRCSKCAASEIQPPQPRGEKKRKRRNAQKNAAESKNRSEAKAPECASDLEASVEIVAHAIDGLADTADAASNLDGSFGSAAAAIESSSDSEVSEVIVAHANDGLADAASNSDGSFGSACHDVADLISEVCAQLKLALTQIRHFNQAGPSEVLPHHVTLLRNILRQITCELSPLNS